MRGSRLLVSVGVATAIAASAMLAADAQAPEAASCEWTLPSGFPAPAVPADNPMSAAKVELGRRLFYDTRLSGNHKQSCASCHLSYPPSNTGIYEKMRDAKDVGKFKAPSLRNIAVTAPYMHDGSVATLEEAIDHYAAGGRTIADGPYQGVGRDNPNKSASIRGFTLTADQRADLIAFLRSLTDDALLRDPRFANPWGRER